MDLVSNRMDLVSNRMDLVSNRMDLVSNRMDLVSNRMDQVSNRMDLVRFIHLASLTFTVTLFVSGGAAVARYCFLVIAVSPLITRPTQFAVAVLSNWTPLAAEITKKEMHGCMCR
jgi:hypothetical protein